MGEQTRVHSIEAITRFRASLAEFGEGARHALDGIDMELRRVRDWLEHDQPRHWKGQIKLWNQRMAEARSALHRKNLQRSDGYVPDVTQEKEALRLCKAKMDLAEKKLVAIRRWVPLLQHAIAEYKGSTRGLADASSADLQRMLAMLDRMTTALESYVSTPAPRHETGSSASGSASIAPSEADPESSEDPS